MNEIKLFKQKQFDGSCVIVQMDPNACDTCDYRCTKECGGGEHIKLRNKQLLKKPTRRKA